MFWLVVLAPAARGATLDFPDFTSTAGLTFSDEATVAITADGTVVRLVPDEAWKLGVVSSAAPVDVTRFSTTFSFRMTGGEGLVFAIRTASSVGVQDGIGFVTFVPGVDVEFDAAWSGHDPYPNHVGIDVNGPVSIATAAVAPPLDDGNRWWAWVDYDGTTLEVRASQTGVRPATPFLSRTVDVAAIVGAPTAFVAIAGLNTVPHGTQDLISWTYTDATTFELCANHADDDGDGLVDGDDPDCIDPPLVFADFSSTTGLVVGDLAHTLATNDGTVLRLTDAAPNQSGRVNTREPRGVARFSTAFSFRLSDRGGITDGREPGGDFLLLTLTRPDKLTDDVAIAFDTYENTHVADPDTNHVELDLYGNFASVAVAGVCARFDDGDPWFAWADYDGRTLEVRLARTVERPADPTLTSPLDVRAVLGQDTALVGFLAKTFSAWEAMDILSWTYESALRYELCGNGNDDDGDGFADCADPDCAAASVCTGPGTLVFPDFTDPRPLCLTDDAHILPNGGAPSLQLTAAQFDHMGCAMSDRRLGIARFSTAFSFRIPGRQYYFEDVEEGGDGFVFVVDAVTPVLKPERFGHGIGYADNPSSVAVEFDTHKNFGPWEVSSNHLGLDVDGDIASVAVADIGPRWDDGQLWFAWIDYDGTTLEVRASRTDARPANPLLAYAIDIPSAIGSDRAHVGFTASTGASVEAPEILSWTYTAAVHAEMCANGTDEDGDGLSDCADPDCDAAPGCIEGNPCLRLICQRDYCEREVQAGVVCGDDGDPCTLDRCATDGACHHEIPGAGACGPAAPRAATLTLRDHARDVRDAFVWRWRGRDDFLDVGNPAIGTSLALCVLDGSSSPPAVRFSATTPTGNACGGRACWRGSSHGRFGEFRYTDRSKAGRLRAVDLALGPSGKGRIIIRGRGTGLDLPALPLTPPVVVRLQRTDGGGCWEAGFSHAARNRPGAFSAVSD